MVLCVGFLLAFVNVALASDVGLGPELITNGGFETGNFTGWDKRVGAAVEWNTVTFVAGSASGAILGDEPPEEFVRSAGYAVKIPAGAAVTQSVFVTPGETYRLGLFYDATTGYISRADIIITAGDREPYDSSNVTVVAGTDNRNWNPPHFEQRRLEGVPHWVKQVYYTTVPPGIFKITITLYCGGEGTPAVVWYDEVSLKKVLVDGSISGKVMLDGHAPAANSALVTFEIREPGTTVIAVTTPDDMVADVDGTQIMTGADGSYSLSHVPEGTYDLTARSNGYLRGKISNVVVTRGQDTGSKDFLLLGADGNDSNSVSITDLNILKKNYGKKGAQ
jgi:hypothetical protein